MILELHIIQNFAPSNLNRSDTGAPKDCIFGGSRRARISSQCFKRAMREYFATLNLLADNEVGFRSKRLHEEIARKLKDNRIENDEYGIEAILTMSGIYNVEQLQKTDEENVESSEVWTGKSESLAFLGKDSIERIAELIKQNPEKVQAAAELFRKYREDKRKGKDYKGSISKDDKKDIKNKVKKALGKEFADEIDKCLDGSRAADLALFGRMLADLPDKNVYASSQVAHCISTHKVGLEFDFYTAVDDLKPEDMAGADMLGTIEFNSACFYRYANVNVEKLRENLQDDEDLTRATVEAYIRAAVEAIPTGKQNSFATHEKPSFVLTVVRDGGMCSLANAFVKPAKESNENDLVSVSVAALENYWQKLADGYGDESQKFAFNISNHDLNHLKTAQNSKMSDLIAKTIGALNFKQQEA